MDHIPLASYLSGDRERIAQINPADAVPAPLISVVIFYNKYQPIDGKHNNENF